MSFLQHNTWSGLYMDSYCPLSNPFLTWFASVPYYHEAKFLGKSSTFLVLVQLHVIVHVHMFLQCAISQHHSWHWCLVLIKYYKIKNDTPVCQILWFGLGMRPLLCLILNFVKVFDNNVLHIYQLRIAKANAYKVESHWGSDLGPRFLDSILDWIRSRQVRIKEGFQLINSVLNGHCLDSLNQDSL